MKDNIKRTPTEWQKILGILILDPDGWDRVNFLDDWSKPLTENEFRDKSDLSTCTSWRFNE